MSADMQLRFLHYRNTVKREVIRWYKRKADSKLMYLAVMLQRNIQPWDVGTTPEKILFESDE